MSWATSTRRSRLPRDWGRRVTATRIRARGVCEAEQHEPGCDGIGTDCDHHQPGDDHSLANLRWLSRPCHKAKTTLEAAAARRASRKANVEPHPGVIPPGA